MQRIDDSSIDRGANEPWYVMTRASQRDRYQRALNLATLDRWRPKDAYDVGCANGQFASRLAGLGVSVVGMDINQDRIHQNQAEHENTPNLSFRHADFLTAGTAAGSADLVCALEVIYYFSEEEERRFLERAWEVLRPGGRLLLIVNIFFTSHISEESLCAKVSEKFQILKIDKIYRSLYYRMELPLIELLDQIKYLENLRIFSPAILSVNRTFYPGVWNTILLRPSVTLDRIILPGVRFLALRLLGSDLLYKGITGLTRMFWPRKGKSQMIIIAEKKQ